MRVFEIAYVGFGSALGVSFVSGNPCPAIQLVR
jgi:hypothetical protein